MPKLISLAIVLLTCPVSLGAAALKPAAVDRFIVTPEKKATLRWTVKSKQPAGPVEYTVRDYWGRLVASGQAAAAGRGAVEAAVTLPRGYHDIEFPASKQRFGLVSLPAAPAEADPFFAVDSAMSWLVGEDGVREGLIQALRRCGIGMSRERLSWGKVSPAAGTWKWQSDSRYETVRRLHAKHGVAVLEMAHDAPRWCGLVGKYPDDLAAAARGWGRIAERWHDTWGALEIWNEPDIFFGANLPADQYVPLVEAVAYALARRKIDTPIVGPVVAVYNRPFLDNAARNGLLDRVDVASFHTYARAPQMEALVGAYRSWLAAHGKASMPLWITECGRPWKKGPPRPPTGQDADSALDVAMKAVEARACGIERYFSFVYPYYEEHTNNFGMTGRLATPLRSMAAYANLAATLAGTRYVGDLKCGDGRIRRARVFARGGRTIAVIYTGRTGAAATVRLDVPFSHVAGIDGRPLEPARDGAAVPVGDGLSFVRLDRDKLGEHLLTDTRAMRLWQVAQKPPPRRPPPSPIVLRYQFDRAAVVAGSRGYRLKGDPQKRTPLTVRAFNLADRPHELTLTAAVSPKQARFVGSAERKLTVAAEGSADVTWRTELADAFAASDRVRLTVTAAAGKGAGRPMPLVVELGGEPTLKQLLKGYPSPIRLPIGEMARWTANVSGNGKLKLAATKEGHLRLTVSFGEGDAWAYPRFRLPDGLDLRKATALVVRARCHKAGDVRAFLWEGDGGIGYLTGPPILPADGEWHTAVIRFDELSLSGANKADENGRLDLGEVRRISIGLNSTDRQNRLDVSDVYVVKGK